MKTYKLDERGNPSPEACREVAACINRAIEKYPEVGLDMEEYKVNFHDHPCGTTHCHAGLFLIGCNKSKYEYMGADYEHGARLMTEMLAFKHYESLIRWADRTPDLWGNTSGQWMFSDTEAFNDAGTPSQIAEWWESVADRIEAYNKKTPSDK